MHKFKPRNCETCGQVFLPAGSTQRWCNLACRLQRSISIDESGCWLWTGFTIGPGYGKLSWHGKVIRSNRASYEAWNGPIPDGMHVLHVCDVRNCINPDHLWLGTHDDNMADMKRKGRVNFGETHCSAKLTVKQVLEIRADERPQGQISKAFDIAQSTVGKIKRRKIWARVNETSEKNQ